MIKIDGGRFVLQTANTTYAFAILPTGQPEHVYYGPRVEMTTGDWAALRHKAVNGNGCGLAYDGEHPMVCLDEYCLEMSGEGKGDNRTPFIELVFGDGSRTTDFVYQEARVEEGALPLTGLPSAYDETDTAQTLTVVLKEKHRPVKLELIYTVFPACDCIVRSARVTHLGVEGYSPIRIERLMSAQLDFEESGYRFVTFAGAWANEMNRRDQAVSAGCLAIGSRTGNSSNHANPFVMVAEPETTEAAGRCYACNLIYSANHCESLEVDCRGKSRFLAGIQPAGFSWLLSPGESFESPQAVLTCSEEGFRGISRHMHAFVREHIVRGTWKRKERPVLLNSWEAAYFHFNEAKLLKLARTAKETGIELFVMDDGWFGKRDNDTCSLGDWTVNKKKLPGGLEGLARKVKALGLELGIWVEPEMVNVDSDLYRAHPDWAVAIPGRQHSEGRHQRILDLTRPEVRENILGQMRAVFSAADFTYVKWDMNRNFSDVFSAALPAERQGEFSHRYIMGLYEILQALTAEFPQILFESCASGGNRFDLGMLCYMPQTWSSDNTDAISRIQIQGGYSYGYPQSVLGAHVSGCPNHQTLRVTPLKTRFAVACFGLLGYEFNLAEMGREEREQIAAQVALYKKWRPVLQYGDWYRLEQGRSLAKWLCVSGDRSRAVGMMVQGTVEPGASFDRFRTCGLDEDRSYRFTNLPEKIDIRQFGGLINQVSPVHIKEGGLLHQAAAHFVKLDGEQEDYVVGGDCLNRAGVKLSQAFVGTGMEKGTRVSPDFDAKLYFLEAVEGRK